MKIYLKPRRLDPWHCEDCGKRLSLWKTILSRFFHYAPMCDHCVEVIFKRLEAEGLVVWNPKTKHWDCCACKDGSVPFVPLE